MGKILKLGFLQIIVIITFYSCQKEQVTTISNRTYTGSITYHRDYIDFNSGIKTIDTVYEDKLALVLERGDSIFFDEPFLNKKIALMRNDSNFYDIHSHYFGYSSFRNSSYRFKGDSLIIHHKYFGGSAHGTLDDDWSVFRGVLQ